MSTLTIIQPIISGYALCLARLRDYSYSWNIYHNSKGMSVLKNLLRNSIMYKSG